MEGDPGRTPQERAALVDDLVLETATGIALVRELQHAVNDLIRDGRVRDSGRLSDFRNSVRQHLTTMRHLVGGEGYARAEARADELHAVHGWTPPAEEPAPARSNRPPAPATERRAGPPRPKPTRPPKRRAEPRPRRRAHTARRSHALPLLAVLLALGGAWVALDLAGSDTPVPAQLTIGAFRHLHGIQGVDARPPSLYLEISGPVWNGWSQENRLDLLGEIGRVAGPAGYQGAQLKITEGPTVGGWFREGGVRLVPSAPD
jgi:hypothetical protein